ASRGRGRPPSPFAGETWPRTPLRSYPRCFAARGRSRGTPENTAASHDTKCNGPLQILKCAPIVFEAVVFESRVPMSLEYGQVCPISRAAEFLGERWAPLIVRELLVGTCRFSDEEAARGH